MGSDCRVCRLESVALSHRMRIAYARLQQLLRANFQGSGGWRLAGNPPRTDR